MRKAEPDQGTVGAPLPAAAEAHEQRPDRDRPEDELIESELLVEDVSIDGMCGVY
jgi:mycofactocin precursor